MSTKVCTRCNAEKDVSQFYYCKRDNRHDTRCKECMRRNSKTTYSPYKRAEKWRNGGAAIAAVKHVSRYATPKGRALSLFLSAQKRAKERGFECELDTSWIQERIIAGVCEVTGVPFDMEPSDDKSRIGRAFSPSLDRVNSDLGYTKENTQVVLWIYNRAKGVDGSDAVLSMAEGLCQRR